MIQQTQHTFTMFTNLRYWGIAVFALFTCLLPSQDIFAQIDGGGIDGLQALQNQGDGGGGIGGGGIGGGGIGGGGIGGGGDSGIGNIGDALTSGQIEDLRNQGFVGATGTRIQELGFVGPPGETSGPPLTAGASFGGGVNDGGGGGAGGGFGGGGGGGGNNQQNGFGGIGQGKGFQVVRKGVRTALTPRFASPTRSSRQISTRFSNRIRRQPNMANDGGGMFVSINGRVATVSGFAQSEAERSRFMRQLRLEPGIDRIVDQVGGQ